MGHLTLYADGFMHSGNPCYSGGFTVVNDAGSLVARRIFKVEPPKKWTNMEAELWGVAFAVQIADYEDTILCDNESVVKWWVPRGACKSRPDLNSLARMTRDAVEYKKLDVQWCPREESLAGIYNDRNRSKLWKNFDRFTDLAEQL